MSAGQEDQELERDHTPESSCGPGGRQAICGLSVGLQHIQHWVSMGGVGSLRRDAGAGAEFRVPVRASLDALLVLVQEYFQEALQIVVVIELDLDPPLA